MSFQCIYTIKKPPFESFAKGRFYYGRNSPYLLMAHIVRGCTANLRFSFILKLRISCLALFVILKVQMRTVLCFKRGHSNRAYFL